LRFDYSELRENLGTGKFIFVGSSIDMWASDVPSEWIESVLVYCCSFPDNKYLFQSKNPERFFDFLDKMPPNRVLATTIETNRQTVINSVSKAPSLINRKAAMVGLGLAGETIQITIEPIMQFDEQVLHLWMYQISPSMIAIGADSKGHHLPEPTGEQISSLLELLKTIPGCEIILKKNLHKLI